MRRRDASSALLNQPQVVIAEPRACLLFVPLIITLFLFSSPPLTHKRTYDGLQVMQRPSSGSTKGLPSRSGQTWKITRSKRRKGELGLRRSKHTKVRKQSDLRNPKQPVYSPARW